ncbi:MAG TPA: 4'-phosphopantetheinyl transferase superfamily protein, partial [Gemmatimonadaceae bacterium]|nr:4'-phosphopantetheinyl transferase superfamily protein [Gemmatimonadaceae bacterium]
MADAGLLDVVIARLDIGAEAADASAALLSCDERERAARFAGDRERRRFTVARARLRELLGARLAAAPEAIELEYAAGGKPRLHPRFGGDLRFNVSHYEDVAAFAFANGREVGVYVEGVRSLVDADAIAALVFSPCEHRAYLALDPEQKPRGFFNCWTRKEAFVKALGEGLRHPL